MCGEKRRNSRDPEVWQGSPPRMRGKVGRFWLHGIRYGITPAYAGKRCSQAIRPMRKQDHPRVCGEKRKNKLDYYFPVGSPPRMRGKGTGIAQADISKWITPAYAGKRDSVQDIELKE